MYSQCGCEGSNCKYDPDGIIPVDEIRTPHLTAEECIYIPPSMNYADTANFLFYYYNEVNSFSLAIIT